MSNLAENIDDLFGSAPPPIKVKLVVCPPPGIYYDVPAVVYHSWPAISSSFLKSYVENPSTSREPFKPGDDANVGSGIHAYSLQGEKGLLTECLVAPSSCAGKSAAALKEKDELIKANPDKTILPPFYGSPAPGLPVMDVLRGVDNSLQTHPKIGPVLKNSQKEVSLIWIDEDSGCICKARLDIWDGRIIWDLKKARSISGFPWQMKDLHYDIQAGFYTEGAIACGLPVVAFGFIPCEAFPPYQVQCGYLDPDKLEAARGEARRLVGLVKESHMNDYWPNFPPPVHIMSWGELTPDDLVQIY